MWLRRSQTPKKEEHLLGQGAQGEVVTIRAPLATASVWDAWSPQRDTVQEWLVRSRTTPEQAQRYPRPGEGRV